MNNKDIATNFLKLAASGKIDEAYDKYVDEKFIHHNAYYPGDRQSLMDGMKENALRVPNKLFDIKRVIEDGDFVAVNSHLRMHMNSKDVEMSVVHILKIQNGKIIEMWDVGQEIPKGSPNKNGMF